MRARAIFTTAVLFASAWLAACARTRPGPARPTVVDIPRDAGSPSPPAQAAPTVAVPFTAEEIALDHVACQYKARIVYTDEPPTLCFDGGEVCFARSVAGQHALELLIEAAPHARALLRIEYGGMHLSGFIPLGSLIMEPAKLTRMAGFVVPIQLRVVEGQTDQLVVEPVTDAGVSFLVTVREPRRCDELTIPGSNWWSPEEIAGFVMGKSAGTSRVLTHRTTPLSIVPGGPAVATVVKEGDDDLAEVFEKRGTWSRILLYREHARVFGWVPSAALGTAPPLGYGSGASGRGNAWMVENDPAPGWTCPSAIPVYARVGQRTAHVGQVEAHQRLTVTALHDDVASVALRDRHAVRDQERKVMRELELLPDVELFVRRVDLSTCTREGD